MLPPTFIFTKMIHFNELYITEDEKNIVIDAEIDDLPVYADSSINKITVGFGKECDKLTTVTVWEKPDITEYDMDDDGFITDEDRELYRRLLELMDKINTDPNTMDDYDVNRDGVVNLKDVDALIDAIGDIRVSGYIYDVNHDGEINIADINALIDYILWVGEHHSDLTQLELNELRELLNKYR